MLNAAWGARGVLTAAVVAYSACALWPGEEKRLTYNAAIDAYPNWSPDGLFTVFQSDRAGRYDIYKIPATGGAESRLTSWPNDQGQPCYSPDGQYIVFTWRNVAYDEEVCIMPAAGGSYINFSNNPFYDALADWSPTGDNIAFVSTRARVVRSPGWTFEWIWIQPYPSGPARRLTSPGYLDEQCPDWSPDGNYIAYHSWPSAHTYDVDIFVAPVAGGPPKNVTNSYNVQEFDPSWSPDGLYIAYDRLDPGENPPNTDVYIIPAAGGSPTRITTNPAIDYAPAWSPDGSRIAFTSARDGNAEIYVVCLQGEAVAPASLGKIKALFR